MEKALRQPISIPYSGIWLRLAQTLETTVRRSAYAQQLLPAQQFNVARAGWTHADLTFLQTVLEQLYNTHGHIRMHELAATCGLSLRQLERRFKQHISIPPKVFARLLRFETLMASLIQDPAPPLAQQAIHPGYQDQAHAIHEFKLWAGCTPSAFLARARQRTAQKLLHLAPHPTHTPIYIVSY